MAYFLSSSATGALTGSLSTNRDIIDKFSTDFDRDKIQQAKYADQILYFPMNFASIWLIENYGLKPCISLGSIIMIAGSVMRLFSRASLNLWFYGHIVCASSQAFLKNPVSKLASNWFGDKERGTATAIGIVSTPLGIFLS
jgi:MFS family permease